MSDKDLKDLTEEEKKELADKMNEDLKSESEEESEGNTSLFNMDEMGQKVGNTPKEQYEKAITANITSLSTLQNILNTKDKNYQISRKNLIKLIFATLKLPEEGATLNFGGTDQQKQVCQFAYAQMQLAANCRAFVMGVDAMKQARQAEKAKSEEAKKEEESKDNKKESESSEKGEK